MKPWLPLLFCPWLCFATTVPLLPGDEVPDCSLVDHTGKAFQFGQFKGHALAVTFLFTRCPVPDFCPLMTTRFREAQRLLAQEKGWHLLSISFDPEHDTPAVLKTYAETQRLDLSTWTLATGQTKAVLTFGESFGLTVGLKEGLIDHNLRTAVIDAEGRVQHVFEGNQWTVAELVWEIKKAMR